MVYRAIIRGGTHPRQRAAKAEEQQKEIQLVQGMDQENLYTSIATTLNKLDARHGLPG